jgi:hypothetical protein
MSKVYVIDACSLINAAHSYNMSKKTFVHIWETLENKIESGELISSAEILDELKDKDLAKWANNHKEAFIPLTQEVQLKTKEVLEKFPEIIKMRSNKNSNGDPFLIATAILYDGVVVTDEGTKANGIPAVCQGMGIEYINLSTYLDIVLE